MKELSERTKLEMAVGRRHIEALKIELQAIEVLSTVYPFLQGKSFVIAYNSKDMCIEIHCVGDVTLSDPENKFPSEETLNALTLLYK